MIITINVLCYDYPELGLELYLDCRSFIFKNWLTIITFSEM